MPMCNKELRQRYINPYTDFAFKRLFGTESNKEILIGFLNALFHGKQTIEDVTYLDITHAGNGETDRQAVFDVYCRNQKGEEILIEMQKGEQPFFKDRSIYFSTLPIREQAIKDGLWNYGAKTIYIISILNFTFDDTDTVQFFHEVRLMETTTHEVFYDDLSFIYLEMPKFRKTEHELETPLDKWMFALKALPGLTERPAVLQGSEFNRLFEVAEIAKFSSDEHCAYEKDAQ